MLCASVPLQELTTTSPGLLSKAAADAMIAFLEGDVFRGSRRMALEDLLIALPEDYAIPGLPFAHVVAIKKALKAAKAALVPVASRVRSSTEADDARSPVVSASGSATPMPVTDTGTATAAAVSAATRECSSGCQGLRKLCATVNWALPVSTAVTLGFC